MASPGMMVRVGADDAALRRGLGQAEQRIDQFAGRVDRSLARADGAFDRLGVAALRARDVLAGAVAIDVAGRMIRTADAWNLATGKIGLYTSSAEQAVAVQEQLFQVAQRSRTVLEPTVGLYTSLADAMAAMGKGQGDVLRVTETIGKSFKISGTAAATAADAITQFAQGLGSGVLRGDEFNSVMEAAPRLARALADGLGVPRGALRALAEAGQLSAEKVVNALLKQGATIDAEFGRIATTVGDAWVVLGNAAQRHIGHLDQATGATGHLAGGLLALADNFEAVARHATAAGAVLASAYVARGVAGATKAGTAFVASQVAMRRELVATTGHVLAKEAAMRTAAAATLAAAGADRQAAQHALAAAQASMAAAEARQADAIAAVRNTAGTTGQAAAMARLEASTVALTQAETALAAAQARVFETSGAVTAAQAAQAAALARTGVAGTVAARALTGINAAMAVVGGPLGAALLVGGAAVAYFATRTSEAERAAELHAEALRGFNDVVDRSTGKVQDMTAAVKALRVQQLEAARDAGKAAIAQQETYARAGNFKIDRAAFDSGLSKADAAELFAPARALQAQFLAGQLGAEDLFAAIDTLARQDERLRPLAKAFAEWAAPLAKAAKEVREAEAALRVLDGTAGDADRAVLGIGQQADIATGRLNAMAGALAGVAGKLGELRGKAWVLSLPEGLERRVGDMVGPPPERKTPVVTGLQDRSTTPDDTAASDWDTQRTVVRQRLQNEVIPAESAEAVRLAKLEADAAAGLAKARASGNPLALKEAEVEVEVARQRRAGLDATKEAALRSELLRKARAEFAGEAGAQAVQLELETRAQERLAAAAGKGEAALRRASRENAIAAASLQGLGEATRTALEAQEESAVRKIRRDQDQPILDQVKAQKALIAAYVQGPAAVRAAEIAEKAHTLALREGEEGTARYNEAKAHYIALLSEAATLEGQAAAGPMLRQQKDQLELGQKQLELMGASAEARAVELARTQALIDLREKNIDAASKEGRAYIAGAEALARQSLQLERATAAYQELEQFGDRAFDAILQNLVRAEDGTVNLKDAVRALGAELQQLALKMAVINPLKNALFGTNLPTIADIPLFAGMMGSGQAAGQAGGLSIGNAASLASAANSAGLFGDTFAGLGSSVTGWLNGSLGSALGFGPGSSFVGPMLPGSTGLFGMTSFTQFLGGAGLGMGVGSLLNSLIGGKSLGGSVGSGVGGLAGAAIGSIIPGIGTILGGILGGAGGGLLGGLFGPGKATPYGAAWVNRDGDGNVIDRAEGSKNGVDSAPLAQAAETISTAVFALAKAGGLRTAGAWIGFENHDGTYSTKIEGWHGPTVSHSQNPSEIAAAVLKHLVTAGDATTDDPIVAKALANMTASTAEAMGAVLQLAKGISDASAGLAELDTSLAGVTQRAKKEAAAQFDALKDSLAQADDAKIGAEYRDLLTRQLRASLQPVGATFTTWETWMAHVEGSTQATVQAIADFGLAISATEVAAAKAAKVAQAVKDLNTALDAAINDASGRDYVNSINQAFEALKVNARDLAALGQDTAKAHTLFWSVARGILADLDAGQLDDVARSFRDTIPELSAFAAKARDAAMALSDTVGDALDRLGGDSSNFASVAARSARQLAETLRAAVGALAKANESLLTGDLSPLSAGDRLAEARRQFGATAALAAEGNVAAMQELPELGRTLLELSRDVNSSGADYVADFNLVLAAQRYAATVAGEHAAAQEDAADRMDAVAKDFARAMEIFRNAVADGVITPAEQAVVEAAFTKVRAATTGFAVDFQAIMTAVMDAAHASKLTPAELGSIAEGLAAARAAALQLPADVRGPVLAALGELESGVTGALADGIVAPGELAAIEAAYAHLRTVAAGTGLDVAAILSGAMTAARGSLLTPAELGAIDTAFEAVRAQAAALGPELAGAVGDALDSLESLVHAALADGIITEAETGAITARFGAVTAAASLFSADVATAARTGMAALLAAVSDGFLDSSDLPGLTSAFSSLSSASTIAAAGLAQAEAALRSLISGATVSTPQISAGTKYLQGNADLQAAYAKAGGDVEDFAKRHWVQFGAGEGRATGYTGTLSRELAYVARYDDLRSWAQRFSSVAQIEAWAREHWAQFGQKEGRQYRRGGLVGYQAGGLIANGTYDVDSVLARHAGGGAVALAGGEHVTRAPSVTPETLPTLDHINRFGRLPPLNLPALRVPDIHLPANDGWGAAAAEFRALRSDFGRLTAENAALRAEVSAVRSSLDHYRAEQADRDGQLIRTTRGRPAAGGVR